MPTTSKPLTFPYTNVSSIDTQLNVEYPIYGSSFVWSRTGSSNVGWRDKVRKGVDASSYYFRSGSNYSKQARLYGTARGYWFGNLQWVDSGFHSESTAVVPDDFLSYFRDSSLRDVAVARLYNNMQNRTSAFNSLVPLAELRELRGLIRSSADLTEQLLEGLIAIRSLKKGVLKKASNAWLTYVFGMQPLLADTKKICESISSYLLRVDHSHRLTSSSFKRTFLTNSTSGVTGLRFHSVSRQSSHTIDLSYKFIAAWIFNMKSAADYTFSKHLGFSSGQLLPAAWELIPYSWVVDYFTTVGSFLDDEFTGTGSCKYVVECRKLDVRTRTTIGYEAFVPPPSWNESYTFEGRGSDYSLQNYWEFERIPSQALPSRVVRLKTLDEMGLHGVSKLLNLAAVLIQQRK